MPIHRQLKNVVHNYTDAERKVREATSNDPWGPSGTLMAEIADKTHNVVAFTEIMQMIWRRLNDKSKNWRHVYKSLVLLEYIVKTGNQNVANQCRDNIHTIETLHDFEYIEEGKDYGHNVRTKARLLSSLLRDEDRLKEERAVAMATRDRLMRGGFGSNAGSSLSFNSFDSKHRFNSTSDSALSKKHSTQSFRTPQRSELDSVLPQSPGEEQLQLQLALAISKEEHEREEKRRHVEDAKLNLALEQSRMDEQQMSRTNSSSNAASSSQLDGGGGLFSLVDTSLSAAPANLPDPWSLPNTNPVTSLAPQPTSTENAALFPDDPWLVSDPTPKHAFNPVASQPLFLDQTPFTSTSNNPPLMPTMSIPLTGAALPPRSDTGHPTEQDDAATDHMDGSTKSRRTPADFLGEHRDLVDLDKLIDTNPASTNPFAVGIHQSSVNGSLANNPFLANQPAKPSLNQLTPIQKSGFPPVSSGGTLGPMQPNSPFAHYYPAQPPNMWIADPSMMAAHPMTQAQNRQASLNPFL